MIKSAFRQAWQLMKQNRFYSLIYILGTGVSITMVMILAMIIYIKIANIYPETNRDRTLIVRRGEVKREDGGISSSFISYKTIETCFAPLQNIEALGMVYMTWDEHFIQPPGSKEQVEVNLKCVNDGFWHVFSFQFLSGKPFTEVEVISSIKTAVISETLAKKIFGIADVVGKDISLDFINYRICGVVKDVPYMANNAYASIWIPYSAYPDYEPSWDSNGTNDMLGAFNCYILSPTKREMETIKKEAEENVHKYDAEFSEGKFSIYNQPDTHWENVIRLTVWGNTVNFNKEILKYILFFFILLIVPAISLMGLNDSQLGRRMEEMGIRRSFGATKENLLNQVIGENLLFTFCGGIVGLLFSYLIISTYKMKILILASPGGRNTTLRKLFILYAGTDRL